MYSRKKIFIIIFLGFISSIVLSSYYIIKYDKYRDDGYTHVMLKDETLYHWYQGAKIVEDIKKGKNFFKTAKKFKCKKILCETDLYTAEIWCSDVTLPSPSNRGR